MTSDSSAMEQAVSRALRDNLAALQRTVEQLHQAVADLVASCSSSRPTNALPPMLRAQTAAASLAAQLDVLSRFVTAAAQTAPRSPADKESVETVLLPAPEATPAPQRPAPSIPTPMADSAPPGRDLAARASDMVAEGAPVVPMERAVGGPLVPQAADSEVVSEAPAMQAESSPDASESHAESVETPPPPPVPTVSWQETSIDLSGQPVEIQELHRRANRVAKVSMQDIKMLRPEQVRLGREHRDLCVRLRDDIEKAHKEYNRRFRTILDYPPDYFYYWMVEVLAEGDPEALGEYPYPSPVLRR